MRKQVEEGKRRKSGFERVPVGIVVGTSLDIPSSKRPASIFSPNFSLCQGVVIVERVIMYYLGFL